MNTIQVFKLDNNATIPTRTCITDAGLDLYALEDTFIPIGQTVMVKTGVAVRIPLNYVGLIKERSSIGKQGLKTAGGVIDAGYSGDVSVLLVNISNLNNSNIGKQGFQVKRGDRIAQLLITPVITPKVEVVSELWQSERNANAFGSSGR